MMRSLSICLVAVLSFTTSAFAAEKPVPLIKEWSGSVADEKLEKDAPACVTNAKDLERVWKAWKVEGKMPDVDFTKELVLVATWRGSKFGITASLDDNSNLEVVPGGSKDLRPGFRYILGTVSRDGVKTVNAKELPK